MCYSLVEVVEEHAVVELLVEIRSDDDLVEIAVVDVVLFVVVEILLLDVVAETVVVDPIPNLLRWDVVVEASCVVVADLAAVDVEVVVVVGALFSFLSTAAVGFVEVVVLLYLVDADEKFSLVDVDFVVAGCRPRSDASPFLCCDSCSWRCCPVRCCFSQWFCCGCGRGWRCRGHCSIPLVRCCRFCAR